LGLAGRALIVRGAWGGAVAGPFDLIVSNPPYVRSAEWQQLAPEIREHEPEGALLAGEDGLDAYRALAMDLPRLLGQAGLACLEHGHDQADAVAAVMERAGFREIERRRDLGGRERTLLIGK
ncbi:MAG TPA: hypothetical protein VFZ01_11365, partial [Geminicoccaceae bacterium]